ncbi:hypothetical protein [Ensifer sp. YR511]|nr:hypothetical protein [Ensifer sp. YR511]
MQEVSVVPGGHVPEIIGIFEKAEVLMNGHVLLVSNKERGRSI